VQIPDLWTLESDAPDWLPLIVDRLLTVGVPPTAIANAFDLDVQVVKDLLADRRVQKFGTAELSEALHNLMWEAYEDLLNLQKTAPITKRMQIDMTLISKASSMIGSQEPDSISKLQGEVATMMAEVRSVPTDPGTSIYETNSTDAPTDDSEERPTS
jgi:hypothetical protein